jgi:hypothetical protein
MVIVRLRRAVWLVGRPPLRRVSTNIEVSCTGIGRVVYGQQHSLSLRPEYPVLRPYVLQLLDKPLILWSVGEVDFL